MIQLQEGFRGCPFLQKQAGRKESKKHCFDQSKKKSSVKDVRWHLKKKKKPQQLFLSNGLVIANAILAFKKRLLHNVSLFIFLVFSKPNCLLTALFQQLVQFNRRTKKKPLTWPFLCNFILWFYCIKCCHICRTHRISVAWVSSPKNRELSFEAVQFFAHD